MENSVFRQKTPQKTAMIECRDGSPPLFRCLRCNKNLPAKEFAYTNRAETGQDLKLQCEMGHAWACNACFVRSQFCKLVHGRDFDEEVPRRASDEHPDNRHQDLTQCFQCCR